MDETGLAHVIATPSDLAVMTAIMSRVMDVLLSPFLSASQVEASRALMDLDTQLIVDGTYYVVTRKKFRLAVGDGADARRFMAATQCRGLPFYRACGDSIVERFEDFVGGTPVPLAHMNKAL